MGDSSENVMTVDNPYYNKWFMFVRNILFNSSDRYDYDAQEQVCRKYARIAQYLAEYDPVGDPMLMEDFIDNYKNRNFTDFDGSVYFVSYFNFEEVKPILLSDLYGMRDTCFAMWCAK